MLSRINSTIEKIWKKMRNKEYRDSFVSANISNTVSAQIHTMRQARGWTQSELAERSDMRQPRISALEDPDVDNYEISTLKRVAAAFDVALIVQFVPFSRIVSVSTSLKSSDFDVSEFSRDALSKTTSGSKVIFPIYRVYTNSSSPTLSLSNISRSESYGLLPVSERKNFYQPIHVRLPRSDMIGQLH